MLINSDGFMFPVCVVCLCSFMVPIPDKRTPDSFPLRPLLLLRQCHDQHALLAFDLHPVAPHRARQREKL